MSANDIRADFEEINRHWDAIEEILESEAYYAVKDESVSGWDCGQQAGHIVITGQVIGMGILSNLANPDQNVDETHADFTPKVFEGGRIPRGSGKAPDFISPDGKGREDFLAMLPKVRQAWLDLASRSDELEACPAKFPHFAFGHLTSAQWVRFVAIHTLHHLYIIKDILAGVATADSTFGDKLKI